MNTEGYQQLLREFCLAARLDAEPLLRTGLLNVQGREMLLFFDEAWDPERLQLRLDLGTMPPEGGQISELKILLQSNFVFGMGGLYVFSINPADGHVVFTMQACTTELRTGQALWGMIEQCVAQANAAWANMPSNRLPLPPPAGAASRFI